MSCEKIFVIRSFLCSTSLPRSFLPIVPITFLSWITVVLITFELSQTLFPYVKIAVVTVVFSLIVELSQTFFPDIVVAIVTVMTIVISLATMVSLTTMLSLTIKLS